jgi:hypothetical protein
MGNAVANLSPSGMAHGQLWSQHLTAAKGQQLARSPEPAPLTVSISKSHGPAEHDSTPPYEADTGA